MLKLCDAEVLARAQARRGRAAWPSARCSRPYGDERIVAVLLSQELIGKKVWTK